MKAVHEDLIRQRAYEIWEASGRPYGFEKEHWAQAERELLDAAPEIEAKAPAQSATTTTSTEAGAAEADQRRPGLEPIARPGARPETRETQRVR